MKLTRRDVLKTTAVALAACATGPTAEESDTTASSDAELLSSRYTSGSAVAFLQQSAAFDLSVASGEVTPESAVVWTRYQGNARVSLHVWDDETDAVAWQRVRVRFVNGFAHETVTHLQAGRRYSYAFVVGNQRSAIGHFRAAIAEDALEPVTFMGYSCTHLRRAPFPALLHAAQRTDLDFWVAGGDKVYCDDLDLKPESYRDVYQRTYQQPSYMALHRSAATYGMWDDHEFSGEYVAAKASAELTRVAKQCYFEHNPAVATDRYWRSFRWGRTLELFLLDCRTERNAATDTYISREQMNWLKAGLASSRAVFKMIVNPVPIANMPWVFDFKGYDRWWGYKQQRTEILSHIENNGISDVWWLSGDFHLGAAGRVDEKGLGSKQRELLWGPGGNRTDPLYVLLNQPQWDFSTGQSGYTVLNCDPATKLVRVTMVNDDGETLFERSYPSLGA